MMATMSAAYFVASLLLAAGTALVVAGICALIAERKYQARAPWFVLGAAAAIAGSFLPWWLPLVADLTPIAAVTVFVPAVYHRKSLLPDTKRNSIWWVKVSAVLLAGLVVVAPLTAVMASMKRTSSATPVMVSREIAWSTGWHGNTTVYGYSVEYTFTADGRVYSGHARREWSAGDVAAAKVCYDSSDPAGAHALELGGYDCGSPDIQSSDP